MIAPQDPAGHRLSAPLPAPGGQPVPPHDPAAEIAALAALLADVVDLTRTGAVYPGRLAFIAEEAQRHQSVRSALRSEW